MRPFTYINLAISIDGKLTTADRKLHGFGGPEDRDLMDELRSRADAVMIGAATLREEDPLLWVRKPERLVVRAEQGREPQPWNVIISRSLDLPSLEGSMFFNTPGFRRLVFTGMNHSEERVAEIRKLAEVYCVADVDQGLDLQAVSEKLYQMGARKLLLEGGGTLNFAMLKQGLVDELYLTLCPLIFGGDSATTAVGGAGFAFDQVRQLELLELKQGSNDRIYLRYRCKQV